MKETHRDAERHPKTVEDTIKNGVKETKKGGFNQHYDMFRAIENGVKETKKLEHDRTTYHAHFSQEHGTHTPLDMVQDVVQNGIKETKSPGADGDLLPTLEWMKENNTVNIPELINDVIENGVKHTEVGWAQYNSVDDVIERGIKRTEGGMLFDETKVDRIISEGVKETKGGGYLGSIEMKGKIVHQIESPKQNNEVEDVIEHGVKLTNSSLQIDGSCVVEDVIQNGIKETHDDVYHHKGRVGGVIKNGIKETKTPGNGDLISTVEWLNENNSTSYPKMIDDVIDNGVKEIKTPNKDGDIKSTLEWMYKNNYQDDYNGSKMINNVIENGIKETKSIGGNESPNYPSSAINHIIKEGVKVSGTFVGGTRQKENIESVIGYGTKNPTD